MYEVLALMITGSLLSGAFRVYFWTTVVPRLLESFDFPQILFLPFLQMNTTTTVVEVLGLWAINPHGPIAASKSI